MTDTATTARVVQFLRMTAASLAILSAVLCAIALLYTLYFKVSRIPRIRSPPRIARPTSATNCCGWASAPWRS